MGHIEIPSLSFRLVFFVVQVPFFVLVVLAVLWPLDSLGGLLLLCSFAGAVLSIVAILRRTDAGEFDGFGAGTGAGYDITNDPLDPAQKAREHWEVSVARVSDRGEKQDDEED